LQHVRHGCVVIHDFEILYYEIQRHFKYILVIKIYLFLTAITLILLANILKPAFKSDI